MPGPIVIPKGGTVVVQPVVDHTLFDLAMKPFMDKHDQLNGAPGQPLSTGLPENNGSGWRALPKRRLPGGPTGTAPGSTERSRSGTTSSAPG